LLDPNNKLLNSLVPVDTPHTLDYNSSSTDQRCRQVDRNLLNMDTRRCLLMMSNCWRDRGNTFFDYPLFV
jgi:hypothetical protein